MDNSKVHRSHFSLDKLSSLGIIQMAQPPYSPDILPCDFYLFGKIKEQIKSNNYEDSETLKNEIINFLKKIPKKELSSVYNEWIKRLTSVIKSKGEYIIE